ncbi:MAG: DUF2889 domain-containing protein [Gammaproteobacteria bacterium]|nr:DUF2889 domain-containing protein [Gammaproteobacteria bacterium]
MPLSEHVARKKIHRRNIDSQGFLREDGLWDIETRLVDTKSEHSLALERGEIEAGVPLHDISLRLTIDSRLLIKNIEASTDLAPLNACSDPNPWYKKLIGEKIEAGWRGKVKTMFAGVTGCTHLNDMLIIAAATAFQTVYTWHLQQNINESGKEKAFRHVAVTMLNSCHGFSEKGEMISSHWPDLTANDK